MQSKDEESKMLDDLKILMDKHEAEFLAFNTDVKKRKEDVNIIKLSSSCIDVFDKHNKPTLGDFLLVPFEILRRAMRNGGNYLYHAIPQSFKSYVLGTCAIINAIYSIYTIIIVKDNVSNVHDVVNKIKNMSKDLDHDIKCQVVYLDKFSAPKIDIGKRYIFVVPYTKAQLKHLRAFLGKMPLSHKFALMADECDAMFTQEYMPQDAGDSGVSAHKPRLRSCETEFYKIIRDFEFTTKLFVSATHMATIKFMENYKLPFSCISIDTDLAKQRGFTTVDDLVPMVSAAGGQDMYLDAFSNKKNSFNAMSDRTLEFLAGFKGDTRPFRMMLVTMAYLISAGEVNSKTIAKAFYDELADQDPVIIVLSADNIEVMTSSDRGFIKTKMDLCAIIAQYDNEPTRPFAILAYQLAMRSKSIRSGERVITHLISNMAKGRVLADVYQNSLRCGGMTQDKLKSRGYGGKVLALMLKDDLEHIKLLPRLTSKMLSRVATNDVSGLENIWDHDYGKEFEPIFTIEKPRLLAANKLGLDSKLRHKDDIDDDDEFIDDKEINDSTLAKLATKLDNTNSICTYYRTLYWIYKNSDELTNSYKREKLGKIVKDIRNSDHNTYNTLEKMGFVRQNAGKKKTGGHITQVGKDASRLIIGKFGDVELAKAHVPVKKPRSKQIS